MFGNGIAAALGGSEYLDAMRMGGLEVNMLYADPQAGDEAQAGSRFQKGAVDAQTAAQDYPLRIGQRAQDGLAAVVVHAPTAEAHGF